MDYRKFIGTVLIGIGVFILNISFQTQLPSAENILLDETGKMLESVRLYCSYYDPNDKDTFELCKRVFDNIRIILFTSGSVILIGGIISHYQWLLSFFRWVGRLFLQ